MRNTALHEIEQELDEYTERHGKIDTVNIQFLIPMKNPRHSDKN